MFKGSHKFAGRLGSLKIVIELIFSSLMLLRFLIDIPSMYQYLSYPEQLWNRERMSNPRNLKGTTVRISKTLLDVYNCNMLAPPLRYLLPFRLKKAGRNEN